MRGASSPNLIYTYGMAGTYEVSYGVSYEFCTFEDTPLPSYFRFVNLFHVYFNSKRGLPLEMAAKPRVYHRTLELNKLYKTCLGYLLQRGYLFLG